MNNRHRIALFNPCGYVSERARIIYSENILLGAHDFKTVLTVDAFGGVPCWHLSAKLGDARGGSMNLFARFSRKEYAAIAGRLRALLEEVGDGEIAHRNSLLEFHYFKNLSDDERAPVRRRAA